MELRCDASGRVIIRAGESARAQRTTYHSRMTGPLGSPLSNPLARDLLRIGEAIFVADRAFRRGLRFGARSRRIRVEVEVEELDAWMPLQQMLGALASFVSHDEWTIDPIEAPRSRTSRPADIRSNAHHRDPTCISLLSDGLDSLCGAARALRTGEAPVFVSHVPPGAVRARRQIASLAAAIECDADQASFWSCQFRLHDRDRNGRRSLFPERSRRTRPVLFLSMAGAVALELSIPTVLINENGVLAVNLPFGPTFFASSISRHAHPETLRLYSALLAAVWPHSGAPRVVNPFIGDTKGEQLRELRGAWSLADQTVSCENARQQLARLRRWLRDHRRPFTAVRECGLCNPCLIRRAALHFAGAQDRRRRYVFDAPSTLQGRERNDDAPLFDSSNPDRVALCRNVEIMRTFCVDMRRMTRAEFTRTYVVELGLLGPAQDVTSTVRRTHAIYGRFANQMLDFLHDGGG